MAVHFRGPLFYTENLLRGSMFPVSIVIMGFRILIVSTLVTTSSATFVGAVVRSRGVRLS